MRFRECTNPNGELFIVDISTPLSPSRAGSFSHPSYDGPFTGVAVSGDYAYIAVGGDGTMNEVAKELVRKDINFGLIPMGSGNGFARSMNIPLNIENALDVIKKNLNMLFKF